MAKLTTMMNIEQVREYTLLSTELVEAIIRESHQLIISTLPKDVRAKYQNA